MTKQERIEEMAHLFCEYFKNGICKVKLKECDIDCGFAITAEKIYTAGYRKIDDDCAVITKAELKQYKVQAVKEFVEKLKSGLRNCTGCYIPNCFESPTDEFAYNAKEVEKIIDELLKEQE